MIQVIEAEASELLRTLPPSSSPPDLSRVADQIGARVGLTGADIEAAYGPLLRRKLDSASVSSPSCATTMPALPTPELLALTERVFVGVDDRARSAEELRAHGITHAVLLDTTSAPHFQMQIEYMRVRLESGGGGGGVEVGSEIVRAVQFIKGALQTSPSSRVLFVASEVGALAATFAAGFLMLQNEWPLRKVLDCLSSVMPRAVPSRSHLSELIRLELDVLHDPSVLIDDFAALSLGGGENGTRESYPKLDMSIFYL